MTAGHSAFARTEHRPWPLPPGRRWMSAQTWRDLLFAHWPVDPEALRPLVPAPLALQEWEGRAWLGVVPFRMTGVRPRGVPPLPWISAFPELNVRTYVELGGRPGVWFLSLDATQPVAVWGARRFFHLPYHRARMRVEPQGGGFAVHCARRGAPVRFRARYRATSAIREARPGTLEHWLTERYCLYARSRAGALLRTEVHHHPWPLRDAAAEIEENTLLAPHGVELPPVPPLLHFSHRLDVAIYSPNHLAP